VFTSTQIITIYNILLVPNSKKDLLFFKHVDVDNGETSQV
jgi:hypothetical protein